ncbi:MAG: hypothetical protein IT368_13780 [Candidatus Hydrogenedentes bacterium]|nr:hypothetical protein [Candidatus Hydrogenedentota bacterium]
MNLHGDEPEFEQLPVLYQRWVEELLPAGIPREREATCLDCAMCSHHAPRLDSGIGFYNKATKCCTYFPDIPNFLAGRAVAHDNPGAAALRAMIENDSDLRGKASMRAIQPNAKFATVYAHHHKEGFGRDPELLCPYAIEKDSDTGPLCGIWQQRNSVCSTWFCKHGRGLTGTRFWQAVQGLFGSLEWGLSWWAIAEVLDEPAEVFSLGEARVNEGNRIALRPDAWRHWKGSRISFYEACADHVERLSAREAISIAGMDARLYQTELGTRFHQLVAGEAPERLRTAAFSILNQEGQRATLQALNCSEPVQAPAMLVPLLRHFDGRPTGEVLEEIREETRIRLDPKLLRRLFDFGILVDAAGAPTA